MRNVTWLVVAVGLFGCGGPSTSGTDDAGICSGGPVAGKEDTHCEGDGGLRVVTVNKGACAPAAGASAGDYGEPLYDTSGHDDDCKYLVSYAVTPICVNDGVTFTVTAKYAADGMPVTGAKTRLEAFLSDTHPAPNSGAATTETAPGTYTIGPVKLDAKGTWIVRYHFFDDCADAEQSPHGHTAFYVNVP